MCVFFCGDMSVMRKSCLLRTCFYVSENVRIVMPLVSKSVRILVFDVLKSVTLRQYNVSESVVIRRFLVQKRVNYGTENLQTTFRVEE